MPDGARGSWIGLDWIRHACRQVGGINGVERAQVRRSATRLKTRSRAHEHTHAARVDAVSAILSAHAHAHAHALALERAAKGGKLSPSPQARGGCSGTAVTPINSLHLSRHSHSLGQSTQTRHANADTKTSVPLTRLILILIVSESA